MKWSLAQRTAGLAERKGRVVDEPRSTADAIDTGCVLAQCGAIEAMFARLEAGAACLMSGGAAAVLAGRLRIPVRMVQDLALEGLARIALDGPQ
jgi:type III pantothenate kinase